MKKTTYLISKMDCPSEENLIRMKLDGIADIQKLVFHMQASMIFTSNDIIINFGVILAGIFVYVTQSGLPDLIIGSVVFIIVIRGAVRILKLR